jgi:hypothetical protein
VTWLNASAVAKTLTVIASIGIDARTAVVCSGSWPSRAFGAIVSGAFCATGAAWGVSGMDAPTAVACSGSRNASRAFGAIASGAFATGAACCVSGIDARVRLLRCCSALRKK